MFLRYFDFVFQPFRMVRNRFMQVRNIKGNIKGDINRVKSYRQLAKYNVQHAKQMAGKARARSGMPGGGLPPGAIQPGPGGMPGGGMPGGGMPGGMPAGGMSPANLAAAPRSGYAANHAMVAQFGGPPGPAGMPPPILQKGMWWWKKHICAACGQELDKTWDACPYCTQQAPPPPTAGAIKTQAISLDAAGRGEGHQMLAWMVPLRGPLRGELFTLAPISSVGTDPGCTVVLIDQYMSGRHAEIKAEGGMWILRDLRSTNGTYVNDKRIEQHELVDSDFVRFGQSLVKFKCM